MKPFQINSLFFLFCLFMNLSLSAQSVEEIKSNTDQYLWGEGTGMTLKAADNNALQMLISQISVQVESKFQHFVEQNESQGDKESYQFEEKVKSVVNTYSNATLHNTERIVISNEPDARVFRYIERKNVNRVFENRKDKILNFVTNAQKAIKDRRIGDGLRYYYWAFTLLKSHPDCNDIRYTGKNNHQHPLISWIPMQMNEVFGNLDFYVAGKETEENMKRVVLQITYKGDPVDNLDYSYWDGRDWSNLINVKDGRGLLEYYGAASQGKEKGKVKAEYIYESQANMDDEIKTVMDKIDPIPFRQSYYTINFNKQYTAWENTSRKPKTGFSKVSQPASFLSILRKIEKAITREHYASVKESFTSRGYEMFEKLIAYGNAKIISEPDYSFYNFKDGVMARSVPMAFSQEYILVKHWFSISYIYQLGY